MTAHYTRSNFSGNKLRPSSCSKKLCLGTYEDFTEGSLNRAVVLLAIRMILARPASAEAKFRYTQLMLGG